MSQKLSAAERAYERFIGKSPDAQLRQLQRPSGTAERADTKTVLGWFRSHPGLINAGVALGAVAAFVGACSPEPSTYDPVGDDDDTAGDDDTAAADDDTEAPGDDDATGDDDTVVEPPADGDGDGTPDEADNCPTLANIGQEDFNGNAKGDACDDADGDSVSDATDNCREVANNDQADYNGNGVGDACGDPKPDADADGFPDDVDGCRYTVDFEEGDTGRPQDTDNDGLPNSCDPCPANAPAAGRAADEDVDGDGVGTGCDNADDYYNPSQADGDHDGAPDGRDNCEGHFNAPDSSTGNQLDGDGDGVGLPCDCNDGATSVHPGATDTPGDGVDSDCDGVGGQIGETNANGTWTLAGEPGYQCPVGTTRPYGVDTGDCELGEETCMTTTGGSTFLPTTSSVDARPQTCAGPDNDCDGLTAADDPDADCECVGTESQDCEAVLAPCVAGTKTCDNGRWGECEGAVGPRPEVCDNVDNNCDGTIDNREGRACVCVNGEEAEVGTDDGPCTKGEKTCVDGTWVVTTEPTGGEEELCDGRDNDCDGDVDNGFGVGLSCTGQHGVCEEATGGLTECRGLLDTGCSTDPDGSASPVSAEVCDHADNDCDGDTDEGPYGVKGGVGSDRPGAPCSLPGVCGDGTYTCAGDYAVECGSATARGTLNPGSPEYPGNCDNLDNDCDGTVDDGCNICVTGDTQVCGEDTGACDAGHHNCVGGIYETTCREETPESPETCDGVDNDCDDRVDNIDGKVVGQACHEQGACGLVPGAYECFDADTIGCNTAPGGSQDQSRTEVCDGVDNDCDGEVDEGDWDGTGDMGTIGAGCNLPGVCDGGVVECNGLNSSRCSSISRAVRDAAGAIITTEAGAYCDERDNNCDGDVDEGCGGNVNGDTEVCGTDIGICVAGERAFQNGAWGACVGETPAEAADICDSADNDCDGFTDEGFGVGASCTGRGECARVAGLKECNPANRTDTTKVLCDVNPNGSNDQSIPETCDGKDNDCDGVNDDGIGSLGLPGSVCVMDGVCDQGLVRCRGLYATECDAVDRKQATETCDGLDNDCDGTIDEGFDVGTSCTLPGECGAGVKRCVAVGPGAGSATECSSIDRAQPEIAGDGPTDSDCDGDPEN